MKKIALSIIVAVLVSQSAIAGVCDYTPSNLIGGKGSATVGGTAAAATTAGIGMKAAGSFDVSKL